MNRYKKAIDDCPLPTGLEARLRERVLAEKSPEKTRVFRIRSWKKAVAAGLAAAVLLTTGVAYALSEGGFFARLFYRDRNVSAGMGTAQQDSYVDVSQLSAIAGSTLGNVIDTCELTVDVVDLISSGNDAMVALRVTANELDSVLHYTGWEEVPINNYRFGSEGGSFIGRNGGSIRYIYSDQNNTLKENQFYLVLAVNSLDGFFNCPYTISLSKFGYLDGSDGGFVSMYDGEWEFELKLNGDHEHSRAILENTDVEIEGQRYTVGTIFLTPFSCTIVIEYDGEPDPSAERIAGVHSSASNLKILTSDNTKIAHGEISTAPGGNEHSDSTYIISTSFEMPVDVRAVNNIEVFDQMFTINF